MEPDQAALASVPSSTSAPSASKAGRADKGRCLGYFAGKQHKRQSASLDTRVCSVLVRIQRASAVGVVVLRRQAIWLSALPHQAGDSPFKPRQRQVRKRIH